MSLSSIRKYALAAQLAANSCFNAHQQHPDLKYCKKFYEEYFDAYDALPSWFKRLLGAVERKT